MNRGLERSEDTEISTAVLNLTVLVSELYYKLGLVTDSVTNIYLCNLGCGDESSGFDAEALCLFLELLSHNRRPSRKASSRSFSNPPRLLHAPRIGIETCEVNTIFRSLITYPTSVGRLISARRILECPCGMFCASSIPGIFLHGVCFPNGDN